MLRSAFPANAFARILLFGAHLALGFFVCAASHAVNAQDAPTQTDETYQAERKRAFDLYDQAHYTEAAPLLDKLMQSHPDDVLILSRLGFSLFVSAAAIKEPELKRQAIARAREILSRSQSLGDKSVLTQTTLEQIAANPSGEQFFSNRREANKAMKEGEAAFAQGDAQKALDAYLRAAKLDPTLYEAPLFAGDAYFLLKQPEKAGEMYARAIAIDPDKETAYRYWGDILTKQGKMAEAREKLIEAYLAAPYSRLAVNGLGQWAQANNVRLAHPKINIPSDVKTEGDKTNITLDMNALKADSSDGSSAWMFYGISRAAWRTKNDANFHKAYPNETTYRHSLAEEADALRTVLESVQTQMKEKRIKQLDPSLAALQRLERDGMLEAYILLARADQGVAQNYAAYRKAHKEQLRRYVVEYILTGGGK